MGSANLDPITNPQAWDTITVAGITSPICQIGEFKRAHEWDVKRGKGSDGATITFTGRPPAKGSVKFLLWTPAHFTLWQQFVPLFKYDPTKKAPQPVDVYHPALDDIQLKSVVTESIGTIQHEGNQLYSVTVEFLEYFPAPPKSAVSTPTYSAASHTTSATPGKTPDPVADAQQAQIANLLTEASKP